MGLVPGYIKRYLPPVRQIPYRSVKILKKNQKSKDNYLRESWITSRVMLIFVAVGVALWGFSRLANGMDYASSYQSAIAATRVVLGIFAAGLAISLVFVWKKKFCGEYQVITPDLTAGICAAGLLGSALLLRNFTTAMQMLYVILPVLAVLYLVYYAFQREFFLLCSASALSMFAMWNCGNAVGGIKRLLLALAIIALDLLVCYANMKSENGLFRGIRVREEGGCPKLPMVAYPVLAALVLVSLVLGAPVAFYLVYGTAALLFAAAIWFTVKLL